MSRSTTKNGDRQMARDLSWGFSTLLVASWLVLVLSAGQVFGGDIVIKNHNLGKINVIRYNSYLVNRSFGGMNYKYGGADLYKKFAPSNPDDLDKFRWIQYVCNNGESPCRPDNPGDRNVPFYFPNYALNNQWTWPNGLANRIGTNIPFNNPREGGCLWYCDAPRKVFRPPYPDCFMIDFCLTLVCVEGSDITPLETEYWGWGLYNCELNIFNIIDNFNMLKKRVSWDRLWSLSDVFAMRVVDHVRYANITFLARCSA